MLSTVGLTERRHTKIRDLSGGQLKRASLANEILSRPNLLFLDEVTSGLDEQADREMMRLFREIANTGKTILCVTHTSANVDGNCTLVVVLASGGKLAFVGSPAERCPISASDGSARFTTSFQNGSLSSGKQLFCGTNSTVSTSRSVFPSIAVRMRHPLLETLPG